MQTQLSRSSDRITSAAEQPTTMAPAQGRLHVWLALLVAGPLLLILLMWVPTLDQAILHDALVHVVITSTASIIGVILSLLVLHIAVRAQDGRVFLIGMGFLSIASIFITHSISTPNVLMSGRSFATAVSGMASLMLGAIFFALSGLNLSPNMNKWLMQRSRLLLLLMFTFLLAYNWVMLVSSATQQPTASPSAAPAMSQHQHGGAADSSMVMVPAQNTQAQLLPNLISTLRLGLVIVGLGCYIVAIGRHHSFYRRWPSQAGLGILYGLIFFAEALASQYFSKLYAISFWLYHVQEFAGFAVLSYAVLVSYLRGLTDEPLLESLLLSGTRARLQAGYSQAMESLIETLSRGEQPTQALRSALRARFGLGESQVHVLEEAATAVAQERRQRQELEILNQSLRRLEAHRDQLTQMIIHDLKNPLTALVGFLDILRLDQLTEEQSVLLESALRSGKNLSELISDLLDVGRIEEGRLALERGPIAPRELLETCTHEMSGWLTQAATTIEIDAPSDLPALYADQRLIRRVVLNLLSNAIKHTGDGTHIILRAAHRIAPGACKQLLIEIEDNGPGIPAEHLERIFEKFGRFSAQQPARQDSTGLGLTLCRLVAEAHGGTIGVKSTIGQGTIFSLALPLEQHAAAGA